MILDIWDANIAQNAMARRIRAEIANETPQIRIVWTYKSPWKDTRLNNTPDSSDVFINHIPGTNVMTRKSILPRFLRLENLAHLIPLTFVMPAERPRFATARRRNPSAEWIVKAATHGGVRLLLANTPPPRVGIVQQRVLPVLLNGTHHFDVGIYALLANGASYIYEDVLIRTTHRDTLAISKKYTTAWDTASPLSKWMPVCAASAACAFRKAHRGADAALKRMRSDTREILHTISPHASRMAGRLGGSRRYFELFRFDFLLDSKRPWLSEVNASPSMIPMHAEDERVKHALLYDALRTVANGQAIGRWRE